MNRYKDLLMMNDSCLWTFATPSNLQTPHSSSKGTNPRSLIHQILPNVGHSRGVCSYLNKQPHFWTAKTPKLQLSVISTQIKKIQRISDLNYEYVLRSAFERGPSFQSSTSVVLWYRRFQHHACVWHHLVTRLAMSVEFNINFPCRSRIRLLPYKIKQKIQLTNLLVEMCKCNRLIEKVIFVWPFLGLRSLQRIRN